MIMTLILVPSKLVDISKKADLWSNMCYKTLLKSQFWMGDQQNTFFEEHLWRFASGHLYYNKKHIYIEHISFQFININ